MSRIALLPFLALTALAPAATGAAATSALVAAPASAQPARPRVVPNDNRTPAGAGRGDTLVLALVARVGDWHPDGEGSAGASIPAFAEEGGAPRIPGPLVRVRAGTVVAATVRNALADTLRAYGLVDRTATAAADTAPLVLAPGARRTVRLRLDAPGTYLYWASTTGRPITFRTGVDAQLTGAIVVDPAHADPARPRDRILVLGTWSDTVHRAGTHRARVLATVNGRAWPHTERLAYTEGDTVRWRVLNGSADLHPVHLHGFHFRVTARADGLPGGTPDPTGGPPLAVTESMGPASSLSLEWVPTRAGNWLFHCHVPEHFASRGPLGTVRPAGGDAGGHGAGHGGADHPSLRSGQAPHGGMGGMVVGITVRPRATIGRAPATVAAHAPGAPPAAERRLRLLVRATVGSTDAVPTYAYAVHDPAAPEPPPDTGLVASPVLEVVRGEPVRITVVNRLAEPTAVHWHGIELDAYYDGVPGFSGLGRRTTPLIAPRDSFVARFAPRRAGTFMYHSHVDEVRHHRAGLEGALVVRDRAALADTASERVFFLKSARGVAGPAPMEINGAVDPDTVVLRAGRTYRFRFAGLTVTSPNATVTLTARPDSALANRPDTLLVRWRPVAKDGHDLPAAARTPRPASLVLSIGETHDVEFTPAAPGELRLEVRPPSLGRLTVRVPVRVEGPR